MYKTINHQQQHAIFIDFIITFIHFFFLFVCYFQQVSGLVNTNPNIYFYASQNSYKHITLDMFFFSFFKMYANQSHSKMKTSTYPTMHE